jgi:plastocyanin
MTRRLISIVALTLAGLALAACGSSSNNDTSTAAAPASTGAAAAGGQTLNGTVGPGFTISMDKTSVAAGTYTLVVDDQGSIHNFHLTGDGVDVKTDVAGTGKKTFTVTLKPGTYNFVCDPHSSQMKGTLTVS